MKTIKELNNEIKEIRCMIESLSIRLHAYIQQAEERFIRVETNSMAQANANYDRWKDARDVYKALSDFLMDKDRQLPMHDADWIEFAKFYAKHCGIEVGNECVHCHKSKLIENGVCNCCGGDQ